MMKKFDLDFVISGGATTGLGHVIRSATLAAAAAKRGWRSRALINGDRRGIDRWRAESGQAEVISWPDWDFRSAARLTIIDHPGEKSLWISNLRRSDTRIVILDDDRYIEDACLTICPALHHAVDGQRDFESNSSCLFGPRYAILAEIHRATPHRSVPERTKFLLSLGGADPYRVTPLVAPVIASVMDSSDVLHGIRERHVVLGPALSDPSRQLELSLARTGWVVHKGLDLIHMAQLMAATKLAVVGFGTTLTELAWHGTPHLSITHHFEDRRHAQFLEDRGIGVHLGTAGSLDLKVIEAKFRRVLEDEAWQVASAETALQEIAEGRGVERILDHLETCIHKRVPSKKQLPTAKGAHAAPN